MLDHWRRVDVPKWEQNPYPIGTQDHWEWESEYWRRTREFWEVQAKRTDDVFRLSVIAATLVTAALIVSLVFGVW